MSGWVKLYRDIKDHWVYEPNRPKTYREAWEDIILNVNFSAKQSLIKGQLIECERGQSLNSLQTWASLFNWSIAKVRHFFKLLEKDQMITLEGLQYTTRLTVCNYETYQGEATDEKQAEDITGHMAKHRPNATTKERKEGKEGKEKRAQPDALQFPFTSPSFLKAWTDLLMLAKWKKKPMSAIQASLDQLSRYEEKFAIKLIENATAGNYQGVVFSDTDEVYQKWKTQTIPTSINGTPQPQLSSIKKDY